MRHGTPRSLLALPVALVAIAAIGCGSSGDSASTVTVTTPAVATATTPVATTPEVAPPTTTTPKSGGSIVAGSSNGKRYRCIGANLLADLKVLSRRINRGRASLERIHHELAELKRRYPNKVAPPKIAQRYNYLVRKYNALLRLGNRRVRAYNARLARDCIHR